MGSRKRKWSWIALDQDISQDPDPDIVPVSSEEEDNTVIDDDEDDPEKTIIEVESPVRIRNRVIPLSNSDPDILPSTKTISREIGRQALLIELEVVICHVWKTHNLTQVMVKDSDNLISVLELTAEKSQELMNHLEPGQFLRCTGLLVLEKISTKISMAFFSVMATFGCQQPVYYKLLFSCESTWEVLPLLDVEFEGIKYCPTLTLEELLLVPDHADCRIILEGKLQRKSRSEFYLTDDSGADIRLKITVLPSFLSDQFSRIDLEQLVRLHFLRYFAGVVNLDQYSSVEQCKFM